MKVRENKKNPDNNHGYGNGVASRAIQEEEDDPNHPDLKLAEKLQKEWNIEENAL